MAEVKASLKKSYTGLDADKADVTGGIGDTYAASDTGLIYAWNPVTLAWIQIAPGAGVLAQMIDHTWEGDNTNDRVIDLGADYDFILVFLEETKAENVNHLCLAYAFKDVYGAFYEDATGVRTQHESMVASAASWQGKMTGANTNKIKLGSNGGANWGTNYLNYTYRLIGFKFTSMV